MTGAHLLEGHKRGSDPFRDCIVICIGHECMTRPEFRDEHGILPDPGALKSWARAHADIEHHDGPIDYLALVTGAYEEWIERTTTRDEP